MRAAHLKEALALGVAQVPVEPDVCVTIASEPGDFLVKEMGVLLTEVVKRRRDGHRFVGVDAGFNVAPERRIYDEPIPLLLCRAADAPRRRPVTVAGNIEGDDL